MIAGITPIPSTWLARSSLHQRFLARARTCDTAAGVVRSHGRQAMSKPVGYAVALGNRCGQLSPCAKTSTCTSTSTEPQSATSSELSRRYRERFAPSTRKNRSKDHATVAGRHQGSFRDPDLLGSLGRPRYRLCTIVRAGRCRLTRNSRLDSVRCRFGSRAGCRFRRCSQRRPQRICRARGQGTPESVRTPKYSPQNRRSEH